MRGIDETHTVPSWWLRGFRKRGYHLHWKHPEHQLHFMQSDEDNVLLLQAHAGLKRIHTYRIILWTCLVFSNIFLYRKMIYQHILNYRRLGEEEVQRRKLQTLEHWRIGVGSRVCWVDESISDAHRLAQGHSEGSSYSFVLLHTIFQQDCESKPTTTTSSVTFWLSPLPSSNVLAFSSRPMKNQLKQTSKRLFFLFFLKLYEKILHKWLICTMYWFL